MGRKRRTTTRGGRPRSVDVERYPNGRIKRAGIVDFGTERVQEMRSEITRRISPHASARRRDERLLGFPLGILFATGGIGWGDFCAGLRYAGLYAGFVGRGTVPEALSPLLQFAKEDKAAGVAQEPLDDDKIQARRKTHRDTKDDLIKACGRKAVDLLDDICIYQRAPRFMTQGRLLTLGDQRDKAALADALGTLAEWFGYEKREAA